MLACQKIMCVIGEMVSVYFVLLLIMAGLIKSAEVVAWMFQY
jgi:hypothetical protein